MKLVYLNRKFVPTVIHVLVEKIKMYVEKENTLPKGQVHVKRVYQANFVTKRTIDNQNGANQDFIAMTQQ